jgi:hypothetical protein
MFGAIDDCLVGKTYFGEINVKSYSFVLNVFQFYLQGCLRKDKENKYKILVL